METKALVKKNMDDVVFENRNQEYGAYSIRKSYPANVNTAFLSCILFAAAVITLSRVSALLGDDVIPAITPLSEEIILKELGNIEPMQPKKKFNPPPRRTPAAACARKLKRSRPLPRRLPRRVRRPGPDDLSLRRRHHPGRPRRRL